MRLLFPAGQHHVSVHRHLVDSTMCQARSMRNARDIRDQLLGLMERVEVEMLSDANNFENIKKAITSGYFYNTAQMQRDGSYRTVKSRQIVHMHPKSGLKEVPSIWTSQTALMC